MNTIIGTLGKSSKFVDLEKQIENKISPISISGLTDMGMVQILCSINGYTKKPICIVTYNEIQAKRLYEDIINFIDKDKVVFVPKKEIVTYDYIAESKDLPYERIEALNKIVEKKNLIVITTIETIMQKLPIKEDIFKNLIQLKIGDTCNLDQIKKKLVNLGYTRCDLIEGRGQFSIRGDIIDISINDKTGVRIELWGDEIDSIRNFNITSQRSINSLEEIKIYPAHEYILKDNIQDICNRISKLIVKDKQNEIINQDIEQIKNGNYISKIDKYFDEFYKEQTNLLGYLNKNYIIVLDEVSKINQRQQNIIIDTNNLIKTLVEKEKIIPQALSKIDKIEIENIKNQIIYTEKQDIDTKVQVEKYKFQYREINYYKSEIENLFEDIKRWNKQKKEIYIFVSTIDKAKKIKTLLEKQEIACKLQEKLDSTIIVKSQENIVTISVGKLSAGFENFELNQIVISADELIEGERKRKTFKNQAYNEGEKVVFADLKIGDYVVHKNYGIGIYIGVNTIKADGTIKDYIKIKYKNDDILYVPTNQLDSIRKYIGGDGLNPQVNKLGSKEWNNTKAKVKKNLREVAKELIELYAKREKAKGFSFSKDTPWQQQFEDGFPYQETDDQLKCIDEIKKDMENARPMDRLLCGDVGYGKTEVAIRAAFKAVMDQKQVAYLVPTTVLAEQQYQEFKERMKDFPIKVEILNRFKTKKYQDEVIRKLKLGEVDIVIGTHRLLSNDVEFKDIGLLIIDEEHRFRCKSKRKN